MAVNLVDSVKGVFTNDIIGKASSLLGESEGGVSKALAAGIPSLFTGIISNAGKDGGTNVLNLAKQAAGSGILNNLGGIFSGGSSTSSLLSTGSNMLSGLLGNKVGGLSSLIANYSGVKQSSINSILSVLAPIALSFVGKQALTNNFSPGGLLNWLNGQKASIANAVPAGLNLSGLLEGGSAKVNNTMSEVTEQAKSTKWLWPLLLAIAAIALLWYLMRGGNNKVATTVTTDSATVAPPAQEPAVNAPVARENFKVKLPGGSELDAYKGGIEDQLVTFLNGANNKPGNDLWFDFDDLNFKTGTAEIIPESEKQLNNIVAILKAYPKVKIKIGGYTDKTGDEANNKKLSKSRAAAVKSVLDAAGVGKQVVGAEGYGSEFAKAAADAPDSDRIKDRHVSVSVRAK